jgi:hypothetical protein
VLAEPAAAARPLLGTYGGIDRFHAQTGQRSRTGHVILGWGQLPTRELLARLGEIPLLGFDMGGPGRRSITPRQVAMGAGDDFLVSLNAVAAAWNGPIYLRPYAEMNGHWNSYCAYTAGGRAKGPSHSTRMFRKAFARTYLIVHGGPRSRLNARLRRLGLPGVAADLPENAMPRVRVIWNPQGYGSPDLPGNSAQAYYPGDAYVDVVGNDLYYIRGKAEWAANGGCTRRTRRSRSRSPNGVCGASTRRPSSRGWRRSSGPTGAWSSCRGSTGAAARSSISGRSRAAKRSTGG